MNSRVAILFGLALSGLAPAVTWAAPPAGSPASQPGTAATASARPTSRITVDGIRDTGQFLPDDFVICKVGPRVTTVGEYIRLYFDSYIADRPQPDSAGRVTFLENIVTRDVLGQVALQVNRPIRFEDRAVLREFEQRTLSNALYRSAVLDSLHIADADVEREYENFQWEVRLRRIVVADRATAVRLRGQLVRGAVSWKQAYDRNSITKATDRAPDGELGWSVRGASTTLEVSRGVYGLAPGSISEPIEDAEGWNLFQVIERRPGSPPALNAIRPLIVGQLLQETTLARAGRVRDLIRRQIGMVYDSTNIAWAAAQYRPTQTTERDATGFANIEFNTILPHFEDADTARVLARYRDGVFTLGRFSELYHQIQALTRPSVNSLELFTNQLDGFVFEPYMAAVARERGLERDSMVVAQMAKKREEILVEHLYSDSVLSRISVDPAARRRYYQENLKGFVTWSTVRFATLWAETQAQADSFAALLRGGRKAEDVLAEQLRLGVDRGSVRDRSENDRAEYHKVLFEELRPGQVMVTGPDQVGHFLVLQKIAHTPGRQLSYEEASGFIDESLQNMESERLLKELVARHRKKFEVVTRPDLVMRIRLVDPTLN